MVWPGPVAVEPPFTPFHFHGVPLAVPGPDDGRKPTLLSRITDGLAGLVGDRTRLDSEPDLSIPEIPEAELELDDYDGPITELRVTVPVDADISPEACEQFLLSLPRTRHALSFEVIGTPEAITVQVACSAEDRHQVTNRLKAHFPDVVVADAGKFLAQAWSGEGLGQTVVVDFGLADEFMLPLRSFRRFGTDPLTGIAAALSDIQASEAGVLQVLLHPVRHAWAQSIMRAVLDDEGSPFFLDAPGIAKAAHEKVSGPLFCAVIRVAGKSPSPFRAMLIARSTGWALNALANPPSNRLIPLSNDDYPDHEHAADLLTRRTRRSGMILSSAEVVSLVHPPSASVRVEKLARVFRRSRPVPALATGHAAVLGFNDHGGVSSTVSLSPQQRTNHLYVVGASGTGKSTMLLNLILQDLKAGDGLAVLDPHGELVDEIALRIPPERMDDVVLIDPADADYSIGLNVLSAYSELERTLIASDLVAVFRRLSTSWGDQMTSVLGNAILAFLESERGGTLVDLRRFLVEAAFRKEFLRTVRDSEVVYYWEKEFPLLRQSPQAPILTRLDTFLRPKTIRYMVAQADSRLDFRRLMDEGKVVLARLSQGAIGEENAYLLGTLLVSKLQQVAMSRQEIAASERRPFYLYVDEFHNFVTPSMEAILSGARKYRLGLVLAHQDLQQIQSRSPEVLNSVLGNPYARVCFRVGDRDARTLAEGFAHFDAGDLQSMATGEALMRVERAEYDFNLRTSPLPPVNHEAGQRVRAEIVNRSRARYGRPRAEIEAMLRGPSEELDSRAATVEAPTPPSGPRHPPAVPESPRVESLSSAPPPAVEIPTEPSIAGRGGRQHKYLQELVRRWADGNDWRATVEERILDGLGNVDVALRKGDRSLACEIGISTSPQHELDNVQKCLAAGFERVLVVSPEKRTIGQLKKLVAANLTEGQADKVSYATPEDLLPFLDVLEAETHSAERTVRGYRVKVRFRPAKPEEREEKRGAVSGVIARAMKRMKKENK